MLFGFRPFGQGLAGMVDVIVFRLALDVELSPLVLRDLRATRLVPPVKERWTRFVARVDIATVVTCSGPLFH